MRKWKGWCVVGKGARTQHINDREHVHRYDLSSEKSLDTAYALAYPEILVSRIIVPPLLSRSITSFYSRTHLSAAHDTPGADLVVGVTGEQSLAVSGPCEGDTLGLAALLANLHVLGLELVNLALLLEVEDDDGRSGGGAQPVAVGREDEGVDLVAGGEGVEVLALVQVPQHGGAVLATGCAERAIGGDGDGVDVAGVADVVGLDAAGGELPDLNTDTR